MVFRFNFVQFLYLLDLLVQTKHVVKHAAVTLVGHEGAVFSTTAELHSTAGLLVLVVGDTKAT